MKLDLYNLNRKKIIIVIALVFTFTATAVYAALTLNSTSITSDGTLTLTPGTWTLTLPTTAGTNGQFLKTDGTGVTSWGTILAGGANYKVYTALLNQDGSTNDPVPIVLENTLGDTVTWTRQGTGSYRGTLSGTTFPVNKTFMLFGITSLTYRLAGERDDLESVVLLQANNITNATADGLDSVSVEIRIYP